MIGKWIPSVVVESAHGAREISLTTEHLMNRKVFLLGEITADTANTFISELLYLERSSDEPITIYINSPGGEVNSGLLIYDAIQESKLEINILCMGTAASMAALILAGGKKGHRFILNHSNVMIHEPLISRELGGSASSIKNISDSIIEIRDTLNGILAAHTGKTVEEVNEATGYDNIMNAAEAVEFGICDSIVGSLEICNATRI